jgi:broad specificity phosphatase PhoE
MTLVLRLVLVRHGETEWMEHGLLHGRLDSPLSAIGRGHAAQAAARLKGEHFDALYASPLGRTMETATILGKAVGLSPQPLDGLQELDFGCLEGTPAVLWRSDGWLGQALRPIRWLCFTLSTERPAHFRQRVERTAEAILTRHRRGRVLVVSHHAALSRMLALMVGLPDREWRHIGPWTPCAFTEIAGVAQGWNGRTWSWEIVRMNDEAHLRKDG